MLIRPDSARATQAAGNGDALAIRRDLNRPSAEKRARVIGSGEPQRHVKIALCIKFRAKGIFVVIAIAPRVGHRLEAVRAAVAIRIAHPRQLRAVRHVQGILLALAMGEPENFIEPFGKFLEARARLVIVHAAHEINIPAPRADRHAVVRHQLKRAGLNHLPLRDRHAHHPIIFPLPLLCPPTRTDLLGLHAGQQQNHPSNGYRHSFNATTHNESPILICPWAGLVSVKIP